MEAPEALLEAPEAWLEALEAWLEASEAWLKAPEASLAAPEAWLEAPEAWIVGGRTYGRTYGQTYVQDKIPPFYRTSSGPLPKKGISPTVCRPFIAFALLHFFPFTLIIALTSCIVFTLFLLLPLFV